jgi:hypothetical protein
MFITIRAAHAALIAAAVTAGVAACGSSAPVDPLASLSANQIVTKTMTDLKAASSVRFSGTVNESGQTISIALTATDSGECRGTITEPTTGKISIVIAGPTIWIKIPAQFWTSQGITDPAEASELGGKYISLPSNSSQVGDFSQVCSPSGIASIFKGKDSLKKGTETTIDGQKVLAIKDTTKGSVAYVTDTAAPQVIRITGGGGEKGDFLSFAGYGDRVLITAPPSNEVLNGSKLGL